MKHYIVFIFFLGMMVSCGKKTQEKNDTVTALQTNSISSEKNMEQQIPDLIGIKTRKDLEAAPYAQWFSINYEDYQVNQNIIKQLKPLSKDIEIKLFMGTWCGDSKQQTPPFYKILDALDYHKNKITLITVSRSKTTPEKHEAGLDIIKVPTFIFYKNGKELNRIVEYPVVSLEEDMLAILSGKAYKHAYANE